jgi:hypothetical protein
MSEDESLKILKQRYAKGEISKKKYTEMKAAMGVGEEDRETAPSVNQNQAAAMTATRYFMPSQALVP